MKYNAITSVIWKLLERGGNAIVQMVVQIVMARLLAPEEFGAMAIILVFINVGNVFVQSGLNTALIQSSEVKDEDYSTVFWMTEIISIIVCLVLFLSSPLIERFYGLAYLEWPLRILSLTLIFNAYNSIQVAIVTREFEMRKIFKATLVSVAVSAVMGISAARAGLGLWALVLQQLSYQIANCLVLRFQVSWRPRFIFIKDRAKTFYSFGWRLLVSSLIDQGYQSLADLIVGKQFSPFQLGLVSQGKKYPSAIGTMLDGSIQPVMLSAASRMQNDKRRVKALVRRALKTSTFLVFPVMVLLAVIAPQLVPLMLGEQWQGAVPYFQVYCFVYALLPVHSTNLQALNGMGRSDLFLKLELIKKAYGILTVLVCAFVFRSIRLLVLSYLFTGILSTFVNALPNKKLLKYSYLEQIKDIAPALVLAGISACCVLVIPSFGLGSFAAIMLRIAVFFFIYAAMAYSLKLETFEYLVETIAGIVKTRG